MIKKLKNLLRYPLTAKQIYNRLLYEISAPKIELSYQPVWLLLYLTDACNLRCAWCPYHSPYATDFEYLKDHTFNMSNKVLNEILERFPEAIAVFLAGVGEPTLHPDFIEIVQRISERNKIIDLTTNGYHLAGKISRLLTTTKNIREVSISLNGCSREEHKTITGSDGFNIVTENIRRLVEMRQHTHIPEIISVSQICTINNAGRWGEYVRFAAMLNVDTLYLHNLIDFSINGENKFGVLTAKTFKDIIDGLPDKIGKTKIIKPALITESVVKPKCQWFFKNLSFDADGNMGACGRVMNPRKEYGNIMSSEDLWNNSYMQNMRATFLDNSGSKLKKPCINCVENH